MADKVKDKLIGLDRKQKESLELSGVGRPSELWRFDIEKDDFQKLGSDNPEDIIIARESNEDFDESEVLKSVNIYEDSNPVESNVTLNLSKLDKITKGGNKDSDYLRGQILKFDETLRSNKAIQVDLSVRKNEEGIDQFHMIGVVDSNGNHASFPIFALVHVYDGISYKTNESGKVEGIKFGLEDENHSIYPDSDKKELNEIFREIRFSGKILPRDCDVNIIKQDDKFESSFQVDNWPVRKEDALV